MGQGKVTRAEVKRKASLVVNLLLGYCLFHLCV